MVSDGIKAARIQAQYSPLINSTWPGMAFQANVMSAVRHATGWLNPHRAAAARQVGTPGRRARCSAAARRADLLAAIWFRARLAGADGLSRLLSADRVCSAQNRESTHDQVIDLSGGIPPPR